MRHVHIHVTGIVQGVGMRPFVYREAVAHGICGWVLNAGDGVHIEAHAEDTALDGFVAALSAEAPAASRVERVHMEPLTPGSWGAADERGFRIVASDDETARTTLVSPDIATCDDCLLELFDPADRRYHYPFINCTNCGPRFTIIRSLPYDRAATSMGAFPMCPACAHEYADPLDRRFHAQPDACFGCGPHITWREGGQATTTVGLDLASSDAIIDRCISLIAAGGIVAIKGLGGFHLACNAQDEQAVRELRRRKRRSNKPLAVMVRDLGAADSICQIDDTERGLLSGSMRPIVLLQRRGTSVRVAKDDVTGEKQDADRVSGTIKGTAAENAVDETLGISLAPSVAFDLPELGVMLPYTPLQHLLLAAAEAAGVQALVMTSGNLSEEPIEIDDARAWQHLVENGIADALLGNDRDILARYDDSVVRVVGGAVMPVRRARGYAPQPLPLPRLSGTAGDAGCSQKPIPSLLACGSEQKATIALTREADDGSGQCFLSQHIGDVENGTTFDAWNDARDRFCRLFGLAPSAIACDLHPSYLPSQWARERARETEVPLIEIQHHHAHIASVMAEAAAAGTLPADGRVLGIAFDGTGAGTDGTVWGGEFLVATLADFERAAHLRCWALPGGAASVRDARRNAFSLLMELGLLGHPGAARLLSSLDEQTRSVTATMVGRGINSPRTSSMGRLFDAVAALLGICGRATYEGEPAIELEAAAWRFIHTQNQVSGAVSDKSSPRPSSGLSSYDRYAPSMSGDPLALNGKWATGTTNASAADDTATCLETDVQQFAPNTPYQYKNAWLEKYISGITTHQASTDSFEIDQKPLIKALLDGIAAREAPERLAFAFHSAVAQATAAVAAGICRDRGLSVVALSGGVFMNRSLLQLTRRELEACGLTVLVPHTVPVNDGCIAYGQAAIARARLARSKA